MDLPEEDAGSYVVKENNRTELKLVLSRCNIEGAKQSSSISKPVVKLHMPVSRVKGIMKTGLHPTTSISCVSQEAAVLVSKATEMFISNLVSQSFEEAGSKGQSELVYDNLVAAVRKRPQSFRFLFDVLPKKVLAREVLHWQSNIPSTASNTNQQ